MFEEYIPDWPGIVDNDPATFRLNDVRNWRSLSSTLAGWSETRFVAGEDYRVSQSGADPGAGPGGDGLGHQGTETTPRPPALLPGETSAVPLFIGNLLIFRWISSWAPSCPGATWCTPRYRVTLPRICPCSA